jgi:flagellar biosynthetic protein FliQ
MGADDALDLMNRMLWNGFLVAAPVLFAALAVGVIVSILQVATQLQEVTLSYVPKLLAAGAVLIVFGPWMIHRITEFAIMTIKLIPSLG